MISPRQMCSRLWSVFTSNCSHRQLETGDFFPPLHKKAKIKVHRAPPPPPPIFFLTKANQLPKSMYESLWWKDKSAFTVHNCVHTHMHSVSLLLSSGCTLNSSQREGLWGKEAAMEMEMVVVGVG